MKPPAFKYVAARTIDEALSALGSADGDAKILAGGQSLTPMLNFRLLHPGTLVDINQIKELDFIEEKGGGLRIGALTRHRTVEKSKLVEQKCPVLAEAIKHVAHVPIRTRGTIGGSISHADPAAEYPMICMLLDAAMTIRGKKGTRSVPATEFFVSYLTTALEDSELLTEIQFSPCPKGWGFHELSRRPGDFAIVAAAATVTMDGKKCKDVRIALGGAAPTPIRATAAEKMLAGQEPTDKLIEAAAKAASEASDPSKDLHGTIEYRKHVAITLTQRAVRDAVKRASA